MRSKTNYRPNFGHLIGLEELHLLGHITSIARLCGLPHTGTQGDAQTCLEMDISCCPFDTNRKHLQDSAKNFHKTHPQSGFEIFCDRHKIDPLTLDKKGLRQICRDFAEYQNQIRERIGGCRIPLSQVYKDVQDYIEDRKLSFCN